MREAINGYYVKLVRKCHYWGDSWRAAMGLNISSVAQRSSARDNLSLSRANAPPFRQGLISPRESARVPRACDFSERDRAADRALAHPPKCAAFLKRFGDYRESYYAC